MLLFVLIGALCLIDCVFFALTPYEKRPNAWWRYAPGSGYVMYVRYRL